MLTIDKRRKIARKFIEKNFGKYPALVSRNAITLDTTSPFELWTEKDGVSFQVIHAPYAHGCHKTFIAVSDSEQELYDSVNRNFDKERIANGDVKYSKIGENFIAYN